jgi:REP element-mobilizing transposase RayT
MEKKIIGYMLTWTTYGTWLQGDKRGYVKNGVILSANQKLQTANRNNQKHPSIKLNTNLMLIVKNVIEKEAERIGQKIYAIAVCSNHVHLVLQKTTEKIENAVARYKNKSTYALRAIGIEGKIWTRGYNKKFLYNTNELDSVIQYVQGHKSNG